MTEPQPANPFISQMPLKPDDFPGPHYPVEIPEIPMLMNRFKSEDPNKILQKDIESLRTRSTAHNPFQADGCIEFEEKNPLDSGRPMLPRVRPAEIELPKSGFKMPYTNKVAPIDNIYENTLYDQSQSPSKITAAS
jgi:hypothetical protein